MGEVYRARDTKLNRDVALKILPDAFASDPDRLARFTREAQTLAALNHPVEASGATWSAGTPMKLLEGRYYTGTGSGRAYDVSPAGQRFLMIKAPGTDASAAPPPLIVVQHWDEELKRLVPTR